MLPTLVFHVRELVEIIKEKSDVSKVSTNTIPVKTNLGYKKLILALFTIYEEATLQLFSEWYMCVVCTTWHLCLQDGMAVFTRTTTVQIRKDKMVTL